jgi:hypothetical protein
VQQEQYQKKMAPVFEELKDRQKNAQKATPGSDSSTPPLLTTAPDTSPRPNPIKATQQAAKQEEQINTTHETSKKKDDAPLTTSALNDPSRS